MCTYIHNDFAQCDCACLSVCVFGGGMSVLCCVVRLFVCVCVCARARTRL